MTPFGARLRELRQAKGVTLTRMARVFSISAAYLSALEHGWRGRPSPRMVHEICACFGLIWDEAEALRKLADLSHPQYRVSESLT